MSLHNSAVFSSTSYNQRAQLNENHYNLQPHIKPIQLLSKKPPSYHSLSHRKNSHEDSSDVNHTTAKKFSMAYIKDGLTLEEIDSKFENLARIVDSHEYRLQNFQKREQKDSIIYDTINYLKRPQVLKQVFAEGQLSYSLNAEFYQHLFNFKLDLQALKQEVRRIGKKKIQQSEAAFTNQQFKNELEKHKYQCRDILRNIEQKLKQQNQESNFNGSFGSNASLIQELMKDVAVIKDKINNTRSLDSLKISSLAYDGKPIHYKYQELLKLNSQSNFLINQNLYYVDHEGYLIDSENRYIVNNANQKIKIEEKHFEILEKFKILQNNN